MQSPLPRILAYRRPETGIFLLKNVRFSAAAGHFSFARNRAMVGAS
jgi:hypothetical protein